MSGHSHWAGIKHRKGIADAKKGKIFGKMAKVIEIAAHKGKDPNMNPALRLAVEKAREVNMPNDNIERAIKKGAGESRTGQLEEVIYEAYGPGGAALIIEAITDNKNRAVSEIKHILNSFNGTMSGTGSVTYMFERKGAEWIPKYPLEITDPVTKERLIKLFEALDDNDDVSEIYSNINL
jgi:YebC/PmpR family DNA-binding regulatory protein